jgi:hypothetical protein
LIKRLKDASGPVRDAAIFALRMIGTSEHTSEGRTPDDLRRATVQRIL